MKVIIIGGVALGATAAAKLKRNDSNIKITIYEKSGFISYSNCSLPYGISETFPSSELAPINGDKLTPMNVNVFVEHEVIFIDEKNKKIKIKDLKKKIIFEDSYDKLILAMGAKAISLPIKGIEGEKTYKLKTYDDLMEIKNVIKGKQKALVIGAGFIGIEIAENIKKLNISTTIVEGTLKTVGMDFDMSSFVDEIIEKNGIKILTNRFIERIDSKNKKAYTTKRDIIDYDIIFTSGITPNVEIIKNTSIELNEDDSIKTNEYMQTNNKDIYAGGDLVQTPTIFGKEKVYSPMARNANSQARLIADHIVGMKVSKQMPTTMISIIKIFDKQIGKAGWAEYDLKKRNIDYGITMATLPNSSRFSKNFDNLIIKVLYNNKTNDLLGIQSIGNGTDKIIDVFATTITAKMKIKDLEKLNLSYQPHYSTTQNPLNIIAQIILKEKYYGYKSICPYAIPKDSFIIDIRNEKQYKESSIWNAINININEMTLDNLPKNKEKPIYVYCNSGFASINASIKLTKMGFNNVFNVYGGNILFQKMYRKIKK